MIIILYDCCKVLEVNLFWGMDPEDNLDFSNYTVHCELNLEAAYETLTPLRHEITDLENGSIQVILNALHHRRIFKVLADTTIVKLKLIAITSCSGRTDDELVFYKSTIELN